MIVFLLIFVGISGYSIKSYYDKKNAEAILEELAKDNEKKESEAITEDDSEKTEVVEEIVEEAVEEYIDESSSTVSKLEELGISMPEKEINFDSLKESVNKDIYAWVYIPDSKIDYPVVQHPTDNEYYLNYNLDGSKGYPGCIYTEDYNKKDFSDRQTVIYGHNMKDGTMFAGLHRFEDENYFNEHPYIYIYTEDDVFVYQIFAAYKFSSTHLILGFDLANDDLYVGYLNSILESREMGRVVDDSVAFDKDSKVLTLSTCVANVPNQRFLVLRLLQHMRHFYHTY